MLDLDAIANQRAGALRQDGGAWREAVWTKAFQTLSARLSDGEVIELLGLCADATALGRVTEFLVDRTIDADLTPLDWLKREASTAGLAPDAWVRRYAAGDQ